MVRDCSKSFIQQQMVGRADLGMDEDRPVSRGRVQFESVESILQFKNMR